MHLSSEQVISNYLHFLCEMITDLFQWIIMVKFQQILNFAWVMEMVGMPDWKTCRTLPFSVLLCWYLPMQIHLQSLLQKFG